MSTAEVLYKPEDLLQMRDGDRQELVRGRLVRRNMGYESSWIAGELMYLLRDHCGKHGLGDVAPENAGFRCFPDEPETVRRPDVSFIRAGRLPGGQLPRGWVSIAPDLAVEVVSPHDVIEELSAKIGEYFAAGVRLVWVIDPMARKVFVHRPDGRGVILAPEDVLDGEEVVPGFRCKVADLFGRLDAGPAAQ